MAAVIRPPTPTLLVGRTRHRRHRPKMHAFSLRSFTALVNVDELDALAHAVRGFSVNRFNFTGLHNTDHLGGGSEPLRQKLAAQLRQNDVSLPDGAVLLLSSLSNVGYAFDPVSWWFCYHADDTLAFIVAEVHNTFGEQHLYLLDSFDEAPHGQLVAHAEKVFHVSPFLPVAPLRYTFRFRITATTIAAHIDVYDTHGKVFDATQSGTLMPFTTSTLWRTLFTHPLMAFRTIVRIHREALVLFVRRVPFYRKPAPPVKDLT